MTFFVKNTLICFDIELIKEACPWFFEMRELIAECPNQVPVGLGNGEMGIDMSVMMGTSEPSGELASEG